MQDLKSLIDQNFLEYASYVIKERAIPDVRDGLKPVQRRILHTMFLMDDGKFNKVANIVGDTMKLHPHGDASIASALIVMTNRKYFIEPQGNFGNPLTGAPASAARYIEARLTPLAKEVLFNKRNTEFIESYDGRNTEPVALPCKIPATLLLGIEGIAVGMSTRILPHNFNEVLDAQIACLNDEEFTLYPDFFTGGSMEVRQYQEGKGKVRVRADIEPLNSKTLVIRGIPYGVHTEDLIQSIQDAVNKDKIQVSAIQDYTTDAVEIEVHVARGGDTKKLLKSLYAFTQCEVSISVNLLVLQSGQPALLTVNEVVKENTRLLVKILNNELQGSLEDVQQQWRHCYLEEFFIAQKVYKLLEDCKTYKALQDVLLKALRPLEVELESPVTLKEVEHLLGIPIKKISRFNVEENQKRLQQLEEQIKTLKAQLENVEQYTIDYLTSLKERYGHAFPRQTQIIEFETIHLKEVSKKYELKWDKREGYLGTTIDGKTHLSCSSYDHLLLFYKDGRYQVIRPPEKLFVGKQLLNLEILKKDTVYNLAYYEGASRIAYTKRFRIDKFVLDKEYRLFNKAPGAKIIHLSQGEGIILEARYVPTPRMRKKHELLFFDTMLVKGVRSRGNRVASRPLQRVKLVTSVPQPKEPLLPTLQL